MLVVIGLAMACGGGGSSDGTSVPVATSTPTPTVTPLPVPSVTPVMPGPFQWTATGSLIHPIADAHHPIISVKDPTVVRYQGQWRLYATTADVHGGWNMVYLEFADWSQAGTATPYYMDATPGFAGYHCAPELFYFEPQQRWYLVFQSGPPTYATTTDPTQPGSWSTPTPFFSNQPSNVPHWIDFWVICDSTHAHLFFTGDDGRFWRSQTRLEDFPNGFETPVLVMQSSDPSELFEAGHVYHLKGTSQYMALIEAMGGTSGQRYYRAFVADQLDGGWMPLPQASSWSQPFIGMTNVSFDSGVAWSQDFSHGELIRDGFDQTLTIDASNLQFLFQGRDPAQAAGDYSQLPYELGLATRR